MIPPLPLALVVGLLVATASAAYSQSPDTFNPGANGTVLAMAVQPDGKILIGGSFTTVASTPRNFLARLNADGSLDAAFNPGADATVQSIAVQPDGKILVAGLFTGLGGGLGTTGRQYIGRLNADGSLDAAFDPGADFWVTALGLQTDGKIVVAGPFTGLGGGSGTTSRAGIGRLNANGTVDAFNPGTDGQVSALALQTDGRIVAGGTFTKLGGGGTTTRNNLGRLNSDGSIDASFNPGAAGPVLSLAVQADGKIIAGGDFTGLGGGTGTTQRARIGRLNADATGTVDGTFNPGANDDVYTLAIQADGRILAGGLFTLLGGGGNGVTVRNRLGRLNVADGSVDASFDPNANATVFALALQADGRVIVGGDFTSLGAVPFGVARTRIGRLFNTDTATQSVTVSGGGTVFTWLRGGSAPEVARVDFAWSTDGVTYTALGVGVRVAGGWQLTGAGVGSNPNLRLRARGYYQTGYNGASASIAETIAPLSSTNIIENNGFVSGTTSWQLFALPTMSNIVSNITAGIFQFYRVAPPPGTPGQAVVFQNTGMPLPARAPLEATFQLGNSDNVRKRMSVLVHDSTFADLFVCTFWLPANAPLRPFTLRTHTTQPWTDATIPFYAATAGSTGGFYQLDNVVLRYEPLLSASRTECVDPLAPATTGVGAGPNLIGDGTFSTGSLSLPWETYGNITHTMFGGVFQFYKQTTATPAGAVLQRTLQPMAAGTILTASFQLGNESTARKRVTVLLHDNSFGDLSACTFWIPPGQPLSNYVHRSYATQAWTNATFSVYPATVDALPWITLDNVTFQTTPALATVGTDCLEPGSAPPDAPLGSSTRRPAPGALGVLRREPGPAVQRDSLAGWLADGFVAADGSATGATWVAEAKDTGRRVLELADGIDLTAATAARLRLRSWLTAEDSSAEIQVLAGSGTWETVHRLAPSDTWVPVEFDLALYLGEIISVRFVFVAVALTDPSAIDVWRIEDVAIEAQRSSDP